MAVLDGADAVHVVRAVADDIMCVNLTLGARLPAYCTAVGQVLLAELPPAALEEYLQRTPLVKRTARTIVHPDALRAELDIVRQRGWAFDDEAWSLGVRAVAVPIRDNDAVGALDIVCLSARGSLERLENELLPLLIESAELISHGRA